MLSDEFHQGQRVKKFLPAIAMLLTGCVTTPVYTTRVNTPLPGPVLYQTPTPQSVVSVYVDPPLYQPPPIRVQWAPPPMLVETVPYQPYLDSIWTGGYWVWEGNWVWAHGRWASPPQPGYGWINPYYENRGGSVLFVNGFWAGPGISFVRPPLSINIGLAVVGVGVVAGMPPIGPEGIFVPTPPGSRYGLIVPAPLGTSPAVVVSAPPVINEGMRIHVNNNINNNSNNTYTSNSSKLNNITNNSVTNVTNIKNVTNVTIIAPASATASGQAVNTTVPAQAYLAAALTPVVRAVAPEPVSSKPIPAYVAGRAPFALPPAQMVHSEMVRSQLRLADPVMPHPTSHDNFTQFKRGEAKQMATTPNRPEQNPRPALTALPSKAQVVSQHRQDKARAADQKQSVQKGTAQHQATSPVAVNVKHPRSVVKPDPVRKSAQKSTQVNGLT